MGKAKGAQHIACERGFIVLDWKLANGKICTIQGTSSNDQVTGVVTIDKATIFIEY